MNKKIALAVSTGILTLALALRPQARLADHPVQRDHLPVAVVVDLTGD